MGDLLARNILLLVRALSLSKGASRLRPAQPDGFRSASVLVIARAIADSPCLPHSLASNGGRHAATSEVLSAHSLVQTGARFADARNLGSRV